MKKIFAYLTLGFTTLTTYAATPLWMRDIQISPDGTEIVFCYKGDIYKVSAKGGTATQLTTQESYESSPVWSPDGKQIAFASDRQGNFDVFVMPSDGGAAQRRQVLDLIRDYRKRGKRILFISDMYLPSDFLRFQLRRFGFWEEGDRIYVSGEIGLTKYSGNLFRYIQREEKISRCSWKHVGDNTYSDYYVPKSMLIGHPFSWKQSPTAPAQRGQSHRHIFQGHINPHSHPFEWFW